MQTLDVGISSHHLIGFDDRHHRKVQTLLRLVLLEEALAQVCQLAWLRTIET